MIARDLYTDLIKWKNSPRRKPLVLQGARQTGKTYLLKQFAKTEYPKLAYFNFEEDPLLDDIFRTRLEPEKIIEHLSAYQNEKILPQNTLILFDEIQKSEHALNALKYFSEQAPDYHLASAGSLLGIRLSSTQSFPVGKVNFLHLYPLHFFEFLNACQKPLLRELLENQRDFQPLPAPIHNELIDLLKIYYFVGGMPEAVVQYLQEKDFAVVREVHQEILKSYTLDFAKHAPKNDVIRIHQIWEAIPAQLAKENKKFIYTLIAKNARGREYESALQWLIDAGLIYKASHVSTPGIPLSAYGDHYIFKIYLLDVGLLGALCQLSARLIAQGHALFTHFKGSFAENFVAQELVARHQGQHHYWTSRGMAEIDFLLGSQENVFPLEVKSGISEKSRSLREFEKKYRPVALSATSLNNFKKARTIGNYPLYAIRRFPDLK